LTDHNAQGVVNFLPNTGLSPTPKHGVNSFPFGKILRQISPLTAGSHQIKQGIDDASAVDGFATFFVLWEQFLE